MSEAKSNLPSSLPGYGLLAVAVAVLFGVSTTHKNEGSKGEAKSSAPQTQPFVIDDKKPADGHLRFLNDKQLVTGAGAGRAPVAKTQFLILTLPDPLDSQLGYWYDQSIDALTRAMSDRDPSYSLIDRWFPWSIVSEDQSKNRVVRAGSPQEEPGVMIYQKAGAPDDFLVVLVVGENPLSGVAVKALAAALDLAGKATSNANEPIRLVGPFCTGSQHSLGRTVAWWARKAPGRPRQMVTCITGSALGLKPWKVLCPGPEGEELSRVCGEIKGTQVPLDPLIRFAHHYIGRQGRLTPEGQPNGPIAYLVESNSGFGNAAATGLKARGEALEAQARDEAPKAEPKKLAVPEIVFRFPMHIGRLAGLRSKEARDRDERLGLIQPGEGLLLATDATRTGGDLIPSADETRTALINQRLLTDYWAQLRRERAKYVWVIATDKRDVLFLLEQLRAECPDARPVVFGADLHYAHPDYLKFMRGVVIVGTYPLFPPAQRWQAVPGDTRRLPFPSSNAQGVYNAVLASYKAHDRMVDYREPFPREQSSSADAERKPPIWVTTVGENGEFVPLACGTAYDTPGSESFLVPAPAPGAGTRNDSPFERPFYYLVTAVVGVIVLAAYRVWAVDQKTARALRAPEGLAWLPGLRAQYVALVGIGGVFAGLPVVLAFWSALSRDDSARVGYCAAFAALALIAFVTAGYVLRQAWLTATGVKAKSAAPKYAVLAPWQVVAFAILAGGAVFGWLLADHSRLTDVARRLFAERAADLYTGCSPVVPAAVIGVALLAHGLLGLSHVRLMSMFRVPAPYPEWGTAAPEAVAPQNAEAFARIHAAGREVEVRSRTLLGAFTEAKEWAGTRWARLAMWGSAAVLAAVLIYCTIAGSLWSWDRPGGVEDPILYGIGIGTAVATAALCVGILLFVWWYEGRVPVARPRWSGLLLLATAGAACAVALYRAQRTWESHAWNCLFAAGLLALAFLTLVAGYRLFMVWKQVERMTRSIAIVPMVSAFDRFPEKLSRVFGAYLLAERRRTLDLAIPLHLLEQLRVAVNAKAGNADADAALLALKEGIPADIGQGEEMEGGRAASLAGVAAKLVEVLAPGWSDRPVSEAFGTIVAEPGKDAPAPEGCWRDLAEQFVAIMAVIFLSQYFARMRYLAYMAVVPAGGLLVAVTAYQFEPERFLMYTAVGFAGAVIWLLVWLLFRINRNELVSRVTRSIPGKFQFDAAFAQNLAVLVLPLAVLVATQLAGRLRSVVEPVLGWVR